MFIAWFVPAQGDSITSYSWNGSSPLIDGQAYYMTSNVTVSGNVTITGNTISIDPSLSITVTSGATFTINHCHLYACHEMWQGIIVQQGGKLIINNQLSTGTTLIEDAVLAIDVSTPNQNNQLLVDNTIFNRNLNAISITNYQAALAPANFNIANSVFTSRHIYNCAPPYNCQPWPSVSALQILQDAGTLSQHYSAANYIAAELKAPNILIPPNSGIILENIGTLSVGVYQELLINGDNGDNTINLFDTLQYGIKATNSNFTCQNNAFQFITGTMPLNFNDGIAIRAKNTNNPLTSLYRVQVNGGNNYFYDCKVAADVYNYDVVNINEVNIRSDHGPYEGIMGIRIETPQCSGIDISYDTITNVLYGILFNATSYSNLHNIHGTFEISNNTIQADLGGLNSFQAGEIAYVGIVASKLLNYTPFDPYDCNQLNVTNNHLYDVRNGIQMENWFYVYYEFDQDSTVCAGNRPVITDNYISLVDPVSTPPTQFGINTSRNLNGIIHNNYIYGFSNSNLGYYGIRCADNVNLTYGPQGNGLGYGQVVVCNDVVNTGVGIQFDGDQDGTKFLNNTMDGSQIGLVLCNNAALGIQGAQPDFACNNSWPVSSYNTGQFKTYTVYGSNPVNSILIIDASLISGDQDPESQGPSYNGNDNNYLSLEYWLNNGIAHITPPNTNNINCAPLPESKSLNAGNENIFSSGISFNNQISRLERLVNDSVTYTVFADQQHINDLFRVYRILKLQPDLMDSSAILRNFYLSAQNGNIGALVNTENKLAGGQLSLATSGIAGLIPQNAIESNYKDFYTVYMHYIDSSYSVVDSIMLKTLVDGCPVRDGMAVRNARTLYSMIYRDFTLYSDFCIDNNSNKSYENVAVNENIETNHAFDVYPNPNNDKFTIKLKRESLSAITAKVIINNVLGHIVGAVNLDFTVNIAIFDNNLSNGVYYFTVIDNKGNIFKTEKVIVLK